MISEKQINLTVGMESSFGVGPRAAKDDNPWESSQNDFLHFLVAFHRFPAGKPFQRPLISPTSSSYNFVIKNAPIVSSTPSSFLENMRIRRPLPRWSLEYAGQTD